MRFLRLSTAVAAVLFLGVLPAAAHVGAGHTASFTAGFVHPLAGVDHLAAMLAVGVWAALAGGSRVWLWPAAFVAAMLAGGVLGWSGAALPFVEPLIAASLVVLGVLIALAVKAPASVGAALVAAFAIAHGHAHGTEAGSAGLLAYAGGFALATALLHAAGIVFGSFGARTLGPAVIRSAGAATAALGLVLLAGIGGAA